MKLVTKPIEITTEQMIDTGLVCRECGARFLEMHGFPVYCRGCYGGARRHEWVRCATKLRADDPMAAGVVAIAKAEQHECIVDGCDTMVRAEYAICSIHRRSVHPTQRRKVIALHRELGSFDAETARRYLEAVRIINKQVNGGRK